MSIIKRAIGSVEAVVRETFLNAWHNYIIKQNGFTEPREFLFFRVYTSHNAIYRSSSKHATLHLHLKIETSMFDRVNGIAIKSEKNEVAHTGSWRRSSERLDENGIKVLRSSFRLTMRFKSKLQSKRARAMKNPYLLVSYPLLCTWHIFCSVTKEQKVGRKKRGSTKILTWVIRDLLENK